MLLTPPLPGTFPGSTLAIMALLCGLNQGMAGEAVALKPQYSHGETIIPGASMEEGILPAFNVKLAVRYLESGARAWSRDQGCVSCHTPGSYLTTLPALSSQLGAPMKEMRAFFVEQLQALSDTPRSRFKNGTRTAQAVYIAAGLAEWDAHVTRTLSPETDRALRFMLELQNEQGTWQSLDCWPPFESSAYQQATVAASAIGTAPGWRKQAVSDTDLAPRIERLRQYLRHTPPPHDYARVLCLRTQTRLPGLADATQAASIMDLVRQRQQPDGGWAIRAFALPQQWGRGNRAEKLRAEPDFERPASDGHMTGLCVIALREAGVPATDPALRRAVHWLKTNQRESGRWWTRSLNTDKAHYITYSGTCYPLHALALCGELGP